MGFRVWFEGRGDLFELLLGGFGRVGEGGELVVGGLEVVGDEDGALLGAMLTGERERDQVAEAAALARQRVLGGEEAVEAGEVLLRAGLGEQTDAYGASEGGRDGLAEEEPDVCAGAGAGELDERVEAELAARVGVGAGGGAEVGVVEIASQEKAGIALAQRVQADVEVVVAAEVLLENLRSEWSEVWVVPVVAAVGGRRPAFLLAVVPRGGVDVLAAAEVVGEQAELHVGGGGVGDVGAAGLAAGGCCAAGGSCARFLREKGLEVVGAEQLGECALEKVYAGLEIVRIWHGRSTGEGDGLYEVSVVGVGLGFLLRSSNYNIGFHTS